jgi:DNA-binding response OmpR family regulator
MHAGEPTRLGAVLLDIFLPDGTGLDLLKEMKRAQPKVPVIVMTAATEPRWRQEALGNGAALVLTKPFTLEDLERTLGAVGLENGTDRGCPRRVDVPAGRLRAQGRARMA